MLVSPGRRRGGQLPNSWCPAPAGAPAFGCQSGGLQHHLVMQGGSCSSQSPETWEIASVRAWEPRSHANPTAPLQQSVPNALWEVGNLAPSSQAVFPCVCALMLSPSEVLWVPCFCHVPVTAGFPPLLQTCGRTLTRSRWARRCRWSMRCCCSAGPPRGCRRRR